MYAAGASTKSAAETGEKATVQPAALGVRPRMRMRLQRQRIRVWVKCQAGSSHCVPFSVLVFIRMLRIRKRLHQRPTHRMHLGKGNAGIGRPVHTLNLTATASGIPIGALQLPS